MSASRIRKRTTLSALATPRGIIDALRALPSEIPADAEVIEAEVNLEEWRSFVDIPNLEITFTLEWDA